MPGIMNDVMKQFATLTGRTYQLFEYNGAPDAERVIIIMGSGGETMETVRELNRNGEKNRRHTSSPLQAILAGSSC